MRIFKIISKSRGMCSFPALQKLQKCTFDLGVNKEPWEFETVVLSLVILTRDLLFSMIEKPQRGLLESINMLKQLGIWIPGAKGQTETVETYSLLWSQLYVLSTPRKV